MSVLEKMIGEVRHTVQAQDQEHHANLTESKPFYLAKGRARDVNRNAVIMPSSHCCGVYLVVAKIECRNSLDLLRQAESELVTLTTVHDIRV